MADAPEARMERRGRAGFIVLDRPRALNALTLTMVRAMARALDEEKKQGLGQSPCGREVAMEPPTQFAAMTAKDDVRALA
jgi:hypothetical protein